jgi:hypothetical protein
LVGAGDAKPVALLGDAFRREGQIQVMRERVRHELFERVVLEEFGPLGIRQ